MSAGAPTGQERVSDLLELGLYVVGNHLIQVLGTELSGPLEELQAILSLQANFFLSSEKSSLNCKL